jgi:hypothetical protein
MRYHDTPNKSRCHSYEVCYNTAHKDTYVKYFDYADRFIYEAKIDWINNCFIINNIVDSKYVMGLFKRNVTNVLMALDDKRYSKCFDVDCNIFKKCSPINETYKILDLFS